MNTTLSTLDRASAPPAHTHHSSAPPAHTHHSRPRTIPGCTTPGMPSHQSKPRKPIYSHNPHAHLCKVPWEGSGHVELGTGIRSHEPQAPCMQLQRNTRLSAKKVHVVNARGGRGRVLMWEGRRRRGGSGGRSRQCRTPLSVPADCATQAAGRTARPTRRENAADFKQDIKQGHATAERGGASLRSLSLSLSCHPPPSSRSLPL